MENYISVLKKYFLFEGRAGREEYWMFFLFNFLIALSLAVVERLIGINFLSTLYTLAVFCPGLGVGIRRMHDIGKSGWWLLISLIPVIGLFIVLFLLAKRGDEGGNEFGAPLT